MAFRIQLSQICNTNLSSILDKKLAIKYESLINELKDKLGSNNYASPLTNFAVNNFAEISTHLRENTEERLKELEKVIGFLGLFDGKKYEDVRHELKGYSTLDDIYKDYSIGKLHLSSEDPEELRKKIKEKRDANIGAFNTEVSDVGNSDLVIYLRDLGDIDYINVDSPDKVYVKNVLDKVQAIVDFSSPLSDLANMIDKKLEKEEVEIEKPILDKVGGILRKFAEGDTISLSRGLFLNAKEISDAKVRIKELHNEINDITYTFENPEFVFEENRITEKEYNTRLKKLKRKLKWAENYNQMLLHNFQNSDKYDGFNNSLRRLEKHISTEIVEHLNELIREVRELGGKQLILPERVYEAAKSVGIICESIRQTSEQSIQDLDYFWKLNTDYMNKVDELTGELEKIVNKRIEELHSSDNEIGRVFKTLKEFKGSKIIKYSNDESKGKSTITVKCMFNDYEINTFKTLLNNFKIIGRELSKMRIPGDKLSALEKDLEVNDINQVSLEYLDSLIRNRQIDRIHLVNVQKLFKEFPLTSDAYNNESIIKIRNDINKELDEFCLVGIMKKMMAFIANELEDLDPINVRRFADIQDLTKVSDFNQVLDDWFKNNTNRLYSEGGRPKVNLKKEKIGFIKEMISELNLITNKEELTDIITCIKLPEDE